MPTPEAILEYTERMRHLKDPGLQARRLQTITRGTEAEAIQGLDGYEAWIARLDEWRHEAEAFAAEFRDRMVKGWPKAGEESLADYVLRYRMEAAVADARANALKEAALLIPLLVKRGHDVA